jgi:hypothetical protein
MVKDDAIMAAHEDLEAYREELNSRSDAAKQLAIPQCATGIKASAHYGIDNEWTSKLYETLRKLDEANEDLNTKIEKFDPSTLFADPTYFKLKARIEQIEQSDAMTLEEKVATFRNIVKETKDDRAKLEEELAKLKEWTANPSLIPASERGVEAVSESSDDEAVEQTSSKKSKKGKKAKSEAKKAKKKAKKGKKK